jgi:hypothetical protein
MTSTSTSCSSTSSSSLRHDRTQDRKFQPEYAGRRNFYVCLVDDQLRRESHNHTVGILICGSKNDHTVRYALGRSESPMAVSTYTDENLPAAEQRALPAADELSAAFDQITSESAE